MGNCSVQQILVIIIIFMGRPWCEKIFFFILFFFGLSKWAQDEISTIFFFFMLWQKVIRISRAESNTVACADGLLAMLSGDHWNWWSHRREWKPPCTNDRPIYKHITSHPSLHIYFTLFFGGTSVTYLDMPLISFSA